MKLAQQQGATHQGHSSDILTAAMQVHPLCLLQDVFTIASLWVVACPTSTACLTCVTHARTHALTHPLIQSLTLPPTHA